MLSRHIVFFNEQRKRKKRRSVRILGGIALEGDEREVNLVQSCLKYFSSFFLLVYSQSYRIVNDAGKGRGYAYVSRKMGLDRAISLKGRKIGEGEEKFHLAK